MASVDKRVVSMAFDNASFERKMSETIKSLDKLRASLDLASTGKGLDQLSEAGRRFNLGGMNAAVDGVSAKFLALATVGITVLSNITSRAVDAGTRIVKALSLDPIMDGFREYELNMNSIQTILANTSSKGSTLEDVNKALDELNLYADQTIYNFAEMTRNIGTFTAAGVDLSTSTAAIKGIANLAAISGSNSQQASTAMYQLSQALATGTVKLMDWNSVVNAGMGGEVFQKALFESGKAMKTLAGVPMDMTFEKWKDSGNSFRDSLQEGWITSEVLINTLQGFTGDLTDAQLQAMGYTDAQIKQIQEMGAMGKSAATDVKTLTQLVDTVKESFGSGWASTFRIFMGDFEEAKALFTEISEAIGGFAETSTNARNEMLQGWKDLGGRTLLIDAFRDAIKGIGTVISPIKEALRTVFPRTTSQQLYEMTERFAEFAKTIKIGEETANKVRRAFEGFFSIFAIGWEILKGIGGFLRDVFTELGFVGGGLLEFSANTGDFIVGLREALVEGGGIAEFFERLGNAVKGPIRVLRDAASAVGEFFSSFINSDEVATVAESAGSRFQEMGERVASVGSAFEWVADKIKSLANALEPVWDAIKGWFSELGSRLADVLTPDDFNNAVDAVNVGLLGGITIILGKFMKDGLSLDFGGGVMENISDAFDQLTGTLKSMQTQIRAKALVNIAIAVGILAASVIALSLIDPAAMTKALTGLSVGFAQLVGTMAMLEKLSMGTAAGKMTILAGGMILLSTAVLILSAAVKNLSGLSWGELAKGLIGVTGLLVALTASTQLIAADASGMIRAGVSMMAISAALVILSKAVKSFAEMSWGEMAKGMVGVATGLGILVLAMRLMPPGLAATGAGIAVLAVGMLVLSKAVESFADMSWTEMGKGLLGVAAGLGAIALITNTMPAGGLPAIGLGITIVAAGLLVMAEAVKSMGEIKFGEMVKGIGGLSAMLLVLAVATNSMTGALAGAAAVVVVSGGLYILAGVLKEVGKLSIAKIVTGLITLAAALGIIGLAAALLAPLTGALLGLGAAIALLGAGFALFGVGAAATAKAFEVLAKVGKAGVEILIDVIIELVKALPRIVGELGKSLVEMANTLIEATPTFMKAVGVILVHVLDTIIEATPKIAEAFGTIVLTAIETIRSLFPEIVSLGYEMLLTFMRGLRDNIGEITSLAIDIITRLASGIADRAKDIVDAAVSVVTAFTGAIGSRAVDLVAAGAGMLVDFLKGIADNLNKIVGAVGEVITSFIDAVGDLAGDIIDAGFGLLTDFLKGIGDNLAEVVTTVGEVVAKFIEEVGNTAQLVIDAGTELLVDLMTGVADNTKEIITTATSVIITFVKALSRNVQLLANAALGILADFLDGLATAIRENRTKLQKAGSRLVSEIMKGALLAIPSFGFNMGVSLVDALGLSRESKLSINNSFKEIARQAADGSINELNRKAGSIKNAIVAPYILGAALAKWYLKIKSPSRVFMEIAENVNAGFVKGMDDDTSVVDSMVGFAEQVVGTFTKVVDKTNDLMADISDASPTITPVLDLTKVQEGAKSIDGMMGAHTLSAQMSYDTAARIFEAQRAAQDSQDEDPKPPTEIKFEQNIYAPKELSTRDIYRNTKSQIALAKEEINV